MKNAESVAVAAVSRTRGGFRRSQTAAGRVMGSWYWASWGSWLDGVVEREGVIKFLTVRNLVSRPRSGRLGSSSSSSCSVALRLVLRTQPRSSLVAGGQRESEHIGRSWLNGVVEPEGIMKFLTVRNLTGHCADSGYGHGTVHV